MTRSPCCPFLDPGVVIANPKPFVGYSDNTNMFNWLWNLGVAGYHGGSMMVHLGRGGGLHPVSAGALVRRKLGGAGAFWANLRYGPVR